MLQTLRLSQRSTRKISSLFLSGESYQEDLTRTRSAKEELNRDFFFKGAAFGIYSTGNFKPTLTPADFKYWKQTPVVISDGSS